jgi:hypothetical protein
MDDYEEIVAMLQELRLNKRALAFIKSFVKVAMKRYK